MPTCKFGNNFGIKCFPRRRSIVLNMICVLFFTVPSLDRLSVLPAVPPIVRSSDYKCVIAFWQLSYFLFEFYVPNLLFNNSITRSKFVGRDIYIIFQVNFHGFKEGEDIVNIVSDKFKVNSQIVLIKTNLCSLFHQKYRKNNE